MSTRIGIIAEGPIDHVLIPALLTRIAAEKAGLSWPVASSDVAERFFIRKRGHGGVLETVRRLVEALESEVYDEHCFVILLDRRTKAVQKEVRKLIKGRARFVLGIPTEEIEAWWLGDRSNTLSWSGFRDELPGECRYAKEHYQAERDDEPKKTLDELTRHSDRFDRFYGTGNLDHARDFAENYWLGHARLDEIAGQCPRAYVPFQDEMVAQFRGLTGRPQGKKG